jgi:tetraprenyl-beta-curcumene synthase
MPASPLGGPRLIARAAIALVVTNVRYWAFIAPSVRSELSRWQLQAEAIDDLELRALALAKLRGEGFHAEAAAMLATVAPRPHRGAVVEAIVAIEVLFDYLDGLTERPSEDPLRDGERAFKALIDAVSARAPEPRRDGEEYLEALARTVAAAVASLPGTAAIADVAQRTAQLGTNAQVRMHAVPQLGSGPLRLWASAEAEGTDLEWRELAAGAASSVLVLHALIVAAAHPGTTRGAAEQLASAYLSTCVLLTLLDGLVDQDDDVGPNGSEAGGYLGLYETPAELPDVFARAARRAVTHARGVPNSAHHVMILVGVIAYYGSAPGAENARARPVISRLRNELSPLVSPTLVVMRVWRSMKARVRAIETKGDGESYDETPSERGTVGPGRCCG